MANVTGRVEKKTQQKDQRPELKMDMTKDQKMKGVYVKMKALDMAPYEQGEKGYMLDGNEVTNFKIGYEGSILDTGTKKYSYMLSIEIDGCPPTSLEVSAEDLNKDKWISQMPKAVWIEEPKRFLKVFQKALIQTASSKRPIRYDTERTGFCTVEGKPVFAFSNGAITEQGFDKSIRSKVSGYDFMGDLEKAIEGIPKLLDCLSQNIKVLYPVFCMNLLSASCKLFLDRYDIDLASTLWLQGGSGAGKTTLAKTLGAFTGKSYRDRKITSSTDQIKNVISSLVARSGLTHIHDDIKEEKTQRQREKRNASIDIVLRSIYQHESTEGSPGISTRRVDTCAIMTGEFMETTGSQNARLILLEMPEFIQDHDNRKVLKELQDHPEWVADVVGGFIQWLINKEREGETWVADIRRIQRSLKELTWCYETYPNGQRLKDSRFRMLFITKLFQRFVIEKTGIENRPLFIEIEGSICALILDTFGNLGGVEAITLRIMDEIVKGAIDQDEVREADYISSRYDDGNQWDQDQFYYLRNDDDQTEDQFLYIPQVEKSFETKDFDGRSQDEHALLIISKEELERRIIEVREKYIADGVLSRNEANKIDIPLLGKMGIILVSDRSDGIARYSKPYPVLCYTENGRFLRPERGTVEVYPGKAASMIHCDLEHPVFQEIVKKGGWRMSPFRIRCRPAGDRDDAPDLRRRFHQGKFRL